MTTTPSAASDPEPRRSVEDDPFVAPSSYLTADIPGIGGTIKERPEDFLVDEIPLYEPCGDGEHLYLFVEKRNLPSLEMVSILARHFGVRRRAVGYAGLKDKLAVTRQLVSVHTPGRSIDDFPMLRHDHLKVLWVDRHVNKLRTGHLKGNRFSIRVRNVDMTDAVTVQRVFDQLERHGVPNRIGEQRFGLSANNHLIGRAYVLGNYDEAVDQLLRPNDRSVGHANGRRLYAEGDFASALHAFPRSATSERTVLRMLVRGQSNQSAFKALSATERKYYLSAFQSAVFNATLDWRLAERSLDALRVGDLAFVHQNRATFPVTDETVTNAETEPRVRAIEISPSGPMWGTTMRRARKRTDKAELDALHAAGVRESDLTAFAQREGKHLLDGTRRPLRVPVANAEIEGGIDEHGNYVRCAFDLPRGAFATVVLREVMKPKAS